MESNFIKLSLVLEELKLKRVNLTYVFIKLYTYYNNNGLDFKSQVQKLDSEVTRLNQLLIEKDSELYSKSNQVKIK